MKPLSAFSVVPAAIALLLLLLSPVADAFLPSAPVGSTRVQTRATTAAQPAFWRRWIPEPDADLLVDADAPSQPTSPTHIRQQAQHVFLASFVALTISTLPAVAVSGGGLDYAGIDISGQDFSSASYKGKDFTQVIAKGTDFAKSNLQGCRFYKAYLVNTNFEAADLRGASLEDTSMDGANLKDAVAAGSYFSSSILDVANLENADFTDAQFPVKTQRQLCQRDDLKGVNPVTGADTRESAMCL